MQGMTSLTQLTAKEMNFEAYLPLYERDLAHSSHDLLWTTAKEQILTLHRVLQTSRGRPSAKTCVQSFRCYRRLSGCITTPRADSCFSLLGACCVLTLNAVL